MKWLGDHELAYSSVVSNCRMNRERGLDGPNSYAKELGLHPLDFLTDRLGIQSQAAWLDLCCGSGRAIIEAAVRQPQTRRLTPHEVLERAEALGLKTSSSAETIRKMRDERYGG